MDETVFPQWDTDLFVYLNSNHVAWLDPIMITISSLPFWIVSFAVFFALMIYKNKRLGSFAALFSLFGVGGTSLINNIVKAIMMRPRPGSTESIKNFIYVLEDHAGTYSFFSGHTCTSVFVATFVSLYFKNTYYTIGAFAWALLIMYSRIYVGMHFPLDLLVGFLFGLLTGCVTYYIYNYCLSKYLIKPTNNN